ncbi:MAG: hypothetical protein BAJALOKI2v1_980012, partial [Promethearchaeota archaeon]
MHLQKNKKLFTLFILFAFFIPVLSYAVQ